MDSASNTWHINPSDLLKSNNGEDIYGDSIGLGLSGNGNMNLPSQGIEDMFNSNYDEVDNILSQELKDLDIPLIPQSMEMNQYSSTKSDINQFGFNESFQIPKGSPANGHKRGPSGTAIFGFANHNKTLSISNLNKPQFDIPENTDFPIEFNKWGTSSYKTESNCAAGDNGLGHVLMKQQEELRIALERQQEVNKKLEQQLRENKLQQQRLQRVLQEQEVVAHQFGLDNSSSGSLHTPLPKSAKKVNQDEMIITSNSHDGYQFPPPSMISPPTSNTSMNGSPSRRFHKIRTAAIEKPSGFDMQFTKYHSQRKVDSDQDTDQSIRRDSLKDSGNPFVSSKSLKFPSHNKKESMISTVSTISHEENESSDGESLVGLGIQTIGRRNSKNSSDGYSLRAPPIDIMPPIPGSTNNTPVKKPQLPQKHVFQNTPVKTQQQNQSYDHDYTCHEKLFKDDVNTPQLKPPPIIIVSSRRNSEFVSDLCEDNEINMRNGCNYPNHKENNEDEEPESRFIIAKTPSPVLKSQGKFEGESPNFDVNGGTDGSPIKITRKPTTLPRGSIDKYVKELPDKLFECMYPGCHKIFKRRYNIRSHIQTHLEDRPYVCDFEGCNKAFVRNHDLVRHKKSHAEKLYACPCGKKFNREDALIVHRSRMICAGGKKYENVVIKKSPRRRGRPKKDEYGDESSSPVKDSFSRGNDRYLMHKMEEQLRNEMQKYGLLRPPSTLMEGNPLLVESPSSPMENTLSGLRDIYKNSKNT